MLFAQFIEILIANKIDVKVSVAQKLYNDTLNMLDLSTTNDNTYALLALRGKLMGKSTHDMLVEKALSDYTVMDNVRDHRKIMAIKQLRSTTACGLKEAKDAVEDDRVWGLYYHPNSY